MGGGSDQISPKFLAAPDIGTLRPDFAKLLSQFMMAGPTGNMNPLQSTAMQEYQGLQTGQGPNSPATAAYKTILDTINTGLPANTGPLADQAYRNFNQYTAPQIREQLGSQYGLRFGTTRGEQLSRAGADVTTNLNAEFARMQDSANQRRYGAATALPQIYQQGYQLGAAPGQNYYDTLLRGIGTLGSQGSFASPTFAPSQSSQNLQSAGQIAALIASMYAMGGCWIAEAIWGVNSPKTWRVRYWLNLEFGQRWYGRPVMWLYKKIGRWVAKQRLLVKLLTPVFDAAYHKATV